MLFTFEYSYVSILCHRQCKGMDDAVRLFSYVQNVPRKQLIYVILKIDSIGYGIVVYTQTYIPSQ